MKKYLSAFIIGLVVAIAIPVVAAPIINYQPTILPLEDSTYEIGTSTQAYLRGTFDELCLTGDTCETQWPVGGGGAGASSTIITLDDGAQENVGVPTLDFDTTNLTVTESPADEFNISIGNVTGVTGADADDLSDDDLDALQNVAAMTEANGDILYYNSSAWQRLAAGSNGEVLKLSGGLPTWGTDLNTGSGGGLATSTAIADTYMIYGTSVSTVGAEAAFTYDDSTNLLTVDNLATLTNLEIGSNWNLFSEAEGGVNRLVIQGVGTNDASELFLQAKGASDEARLTLSSDENTNNYEFLEIESNGVAHHINSSSTGTGTTLPFDIRMNGNDVIVIATDNSINFSQLTTNGLLQVTGGDGSVSASTTISDSFIPSTIARDSELHSAVTLAGEDYLSLATQQITANAIDPDNLSASDFGSFTCNGTTCTLDSGSVSTTQILDDTIAFGDVAHTLTLAANPALAASQCYWASTGIICEGSTANTVETLLTFTNPTTDRTITFPDATGEVSLLGQSIDISDETNLTAGDALTLTGDNIDFDGGTAPGGELGGTWASPTIDDSLAVSSWNLTTPTFTTNFTFDSVTVTGLTGIDTSIVTGTAGTSGNCAEWDANGDLVDAGAECGTGGGGGGGNLSTTTEKIGAGASSTVSYVTDEFMIGGASSTTCEFCFDNSSSTLEIRGNGTTSVMSTGAQEAVQIGEGDRNSDDAWTMGEGIEFDFGTAGDVIVRGLSSVTEWVTDLAVTISGALTLTGNFIFDAQTFDSFTDDATLTNNAGDLQVVDVNCTDCLGTTEIADSYLLNNGDAGTGAYDFGGATSFEIPNGTGNTVNADGQIAHDTTDDQLIIGADADVIRTQEKIFSFTLASTSLEFVSGGEIPVPLEKDGYTVTNIKCYVQGGTSVQMTLTDNTNAMDTLTCATTATTDDGTIANATVSADELMYVDVGTITGTPDYVTFSVFGAWTRE